MPFDIGPIELTLILVIVAMLFGVGKLPEIFGAIGKGIREFRKEMTDDQKRASPIRTSPSTDIDTKDNAEHNAGDNSLNSA